MILGRWHLRVTDDRGRARVSLFNGQTAIGIVTISAEDYAMICRKLLQMIRTVSFDAIQKALNNRIWQDAQRIFDNSPELAKAKLIEFGWSQEMIDSYAEELSRSIAQALVEHLPEHSL